MTFLVRAGLVEGWDARYYLKRDPIPVLEVETSSLGSLRTELAWMETSSL